MFPNTPIFVALLTALAVMMFFIASWLIFRRRDSVEQRLLEYSRQNAINLNTPIQGDAAKRYNMSFFQKLLSGFGLGPQLALALTRADIPMTATEYMLIIMLLAALGFGIGTWRVNSIVGLGIGATLAAIPFVVLRMKQRRRVRDFEKQVPDMLTLLVGSLRAGFGLSQALDLLVKRLGSPASDEIAKITTAINLGIPTKRALEEAASRIGSSDFNLVVIAITVQLESGGNLAETLEIIAETVRHRLHILSEIRVLTAQQRFTGYTLAFLPLFAALALFLVNPEYMGRLFEPGFMRMVSIGVVVMQVIGFLVIQRIVDIEV